MFARILIEFVLRMAFGLAVAMFITSARHVTSGYFRVHLWVVMGLNTLAALVIAGQMPDLPEASRALPITILAAILSYAGSVAWLYERAVLGKWLLMSVALLDGLAAFWFPVPQFAPSFWSLLDVMGGGLLLGFALAAMLLGHWYLNTPTMHLEPLKRLLCAFMAAVVLRGIFEAWAVLVDPHTPTLASSTYYSVLSLRWISGILGALLLSIMAWQTLRIPNTQSATGILYVVVICVFLGELSSFWLLTSYGKSV